MKVNTKKKPNNVILMASTIGGGFPDGRSRHN